MNFAVDVLRLVAWLVLLVSIFVPLERFFAIRPAKIWRKQVGVDLGWYFINSLLPAAMLAVPLAMLSRALRGVDPLGFYSSVAAWPVWVKLPVVLIVSDLGAYWAHRTSHSIPFLWRFHAVHHSAEHLDWLVNTRAHPLDMVFTRFAALAPIYLLGLAQTTGHPVDPVLALVQIFGIAWTFFIHSNIRCRLGPLEWLISTPAFHHWHHTNDEHRDRNFAPLFPWIDKVFGTEWLPKSWPTKYGIDETLSATVLGQLMDPLRKRRVEASEPPATASTNTSEASSAKGSQQ